MDTLPEEVLLRIFSYSSWEELKLLSLVNRHWYRVTGTRSLVAKVSLHLSKVNYLKWQGSTIARSVVVNSARQYSSVSCWLGFRGQKPIDPTELGYNLMVSFSKWEIKRVTVIGQYDQVLQFFLDYGEMLASIEELSVILDLFTRKRYESDDQDRESWHLHLGKLRSLSWVERLLPKGLEPKPQSFVFVVPQLQQMRIHKKSKENNLLLLDCTNLKRADINSYDLLSSSLFDSKYSALEQLTIAGTGNASLHLSKKSHLLANLRNIDLTGCTWEALKVVNLFARHLKVLKLSNMRDHFAFGPTLEHLNEICLKSISSMPFFGDVYLKCPHLAKLTALEVDFDLPLKLKAPHLSTLIVDQRALEFIVLEDTSTVLNLGISRLHAPFLRNTTPLPPHYPNVVHLCLKLSGIPLDTEIKTILRSYWKINKLTIAKARFVSILYLTEAILFSPYLKLVHLHSINQIAIFPDTYYRSQPNPLLDERLPIYFKHLLITRSKLNVDYISYASDTPWIRFYRTQFRDLRSSEYASPSLLETISPPLIRDEPRVGELLFGTTVESSYSTRGFIFDESDEMLNW